MSSSKPSDIQVRCTVNTKPVTLKGHAMSRLLDALREDAGLTGTKEGCGEGECGACSVLIDGKIVNSCLVPLAQAEGATVMTIEGLAGDGDLHVVQQAFLERGGAQCGICTPGMILAAYTLIKTAPNPAALDEAGIREGLAGNLCRCTGYMKIFDSVALAASRMPGSGAAP